MWESAASRPHATRYGRESTPTRRSGMLWRSLRDVVLGHAGVVARRARTGHSERAVGRCMTSLVVSVCALVVLVAVACADGDSPASLKSDPGRSTDGATEEVTGVPLAEPASGLAQQCRSAARSLGFAVPCPTRLPLVAGEPVDCSGDCIGLAGERGAEVRVFFLNVEGYDANAGGPETVRHLIVEAQRAQDAPPSPCYEGVPAGVLEANGQEVALLECPPDSPQARANIRHGEGAHIEHLLAYWDSHGIRYVVSVHRTSAGDRPLLERLVSSIELIGP